MISILALCVLAILVRYPKSTSTDSENTGLLVHGAPKSHVMASSQEKSINRDHPAAETFRSYGKWNLQIARENRIDGNMARNSGSFLTEDFQIASSAIERLQLTPNEITKLNTVLRDTFSKAQEQFLSRIEKVTDDESSADRYRLPADPAQADSLLSDFSNKVSEIINNDRADIFVNYLDFGRYFGGMGMYDTIITFDELIARDKESGKTKNLGVGCHYESRDPQTGAMRNNGGLTKKDWLRIYGTTFQLESGALSSQNNE